jgi:hypothetical protein
MIKKRLTAIYSRFENQWQYLAMITILVFKVIPHTQVLPWVSDKTMAIFPRTLPHAYVFFLSWSATACTALCTASGSPR